MWILSWVPKPATGGAGCLLSIFLLYPFIALFQYLDFCSYKDEVEILNAECYGFVWNDEANSYQNGAEYANFGVEFTFDDEPVSSIQVDTLVYKGDEFIGYITHNFEVADFPNDSEVTEDDELCFKRNTTTTLYFNIHHVTGKEWDEDDIITELYFGDLDDYTFVSEIIYISFCDFTLVGRFSSLGHYYDTEGNIHWVEDE